MATISAATWPGAADPRAPARPPAAARQVLLGPEPQIAGASGGVLVRLRRGAPAWGPAARRGRWVPAAIRLGGAGLRDLFRQLAQFGVFGCLQAADLLFQRADAGHLADVGGHAPEQQVARHVEGARRQVALVGVGLHVRGARQALRRGRRRPVCFHLGSRPPAAPRRPPGRGRHPDRRSSGGVTKPEREKSW